MKILFDTNIFRDVQRGVINTKEIKNRLKSLNATSYCSPISLIELGSHICDHEKENFQNYQKAFKAILEICGTALPDPDNFIRKYLFHNDSCAGLDPNETIRICQLIADAKSYDILMKGQNVLWYGIPSIVAYKGHQAYDFRNNYEKNYINDMLNHVVLNLIPDYFEKKITGNLPKIDDSDFRKKVLNYIDSKGFSDLIYNGIALRAGVFLLKESNTIWDQNVIEKLQAFTNAYKWIIKKIVEAGYNVEKKKNDFNDINFLLYLADPDLIFITCDNGICQKVGSYMQSGRIKTFSTWITS